MMRNYEVAIDTYQSLNLIQMLNTEENERYQQCLNIYSEYVDFNIYISQNVAGRKVNMKLSWASILFSKFCVTSVSLLQLLPNNKIAVQSIEHWDFPSIATLTRNLIENYHTLFYLCMDNITNAEWQCRKELCNLHDCLSRKKMFIDFGHSEDDIEQFEQQSNQLREKIKKNSFFNTLPEHNQKKFLKGDHAFLLTRDEIEARLNNNKPSHLKAMYRFLSSQTHSFPMSFYRTLEQKRGTGVATEVEVVYTTMALEYATQYLQSVAGNIIKLFPDIKGKLNSKQKELLTQTLLLTYFK